MASLLLLAGCPRDDAPAPPPPFSCATAAAALGRPAATVNACENVAGIPELYQVSLTEGDAGPTHLSLLVRDGRAEPLPAGAPAFAKLLRALPVERRRALTFADVNDLLRVFDAFPPRFGPRDWRFDLPDIGRSSFTPDPFLLELYVAIPPTPDRPADPTTYGRATLRLIGEPWAWELSERRADGTWSEAVELPIPSAE